MTCRSWRSSERWSLWAECWSIDENENDSLRQWSDRGLSFVRAMSAQLHSTSLSCLSLSLANHLQYLTRVWYIAAGNTSRWKLTFPKKEFCHHNQHEFTIFKLKLNRLFSFHILRIYFFAYRYQHHRGSPSSSIKAVGYFFPLFYCFANIYSP